MTNLKDLKKGDFFKVYEGAKNIYQKCDYNRTTKKYNCQNLQTGNYLQFAAKKEIFINFEF